MNLFPVAYASTIPLIGAINEEIVQPIINLLFMAAFLVFAWGIIEFVSQADNPTKREDGKRHMLWGIIGLFIMTAVFGILHLICNFIGAC